MPTPKTVKLAAAKKRRTRTRRKPSTRSRRTHEWLEDTFSELGIILTWVGIGIIIAVACWLFITVELNDATVINQRAWKLAEFFGYQPPPNVGDPHLNPSPPSLTEQQKNKQALLDSLERTLLIYQDMDWENMSEARRRHFELQRQLLRHQADTLRQELQLGR